MSLEDKLVKCVIGVMWQELIDNEEYDIDNFTDNLNKKIKNLRNEILK